MISSTNKQLGNNFNVTKRKNFSLNYSHQTCNSNVSSSVSSSSSSTTDLPIFYPPAQTSIEPSSPINQNNFIRYNTMVLTPNESQPNQQDNKYYTTNTYYYNTPVTTPTSTPHTPKYQNGYYIQNNQVHTPPSVYHHQQAYQQNVSEINNQTMDDTFYQQSPNESNLSPESNNLVIINF